MIYCTGACTATLRSSSNRSSNFSSLPGKRERGSLPAKRQSSLCKASEAPSTPQASSLNNSWPQNLRNHFLQPQVGFQFTHSQPNCPFFVCFLKRKVFFYQKFWRRNNIWVYLSVCILHTLSWGKNNSFHFSTLVNINF